MRIERIRFSHIAPVVLSLFAAAAVFGQETRMRWDIVSAQFGGTLAGSPCNPGCVSPGGFASASATNGDVTKIRLKITLTGSGTFSPYDPTDVTGGGEFTIRNEDQSRVLATGRYTVTELVSFVVDSAQPPGAVNRITNTTAADFRNGLAIFRIAYADGSKGVLIVSCHGPGASDDPYEGVSITKGAVHFAIPEGPIDNTVDANRTVFVVIPASR